MKRCLQLAKLGAGYVAPNPMVGSLLVYENKIIGEGFHEQFGHPHAEVNAIRDAVQKGNRDLINRSTLFVSLEPCAHFGKTPPCTELIIENKVPKVVIGCRDPNPVVNGQGIQRLIEAGVEVNEGPALGRIEEECKELNKRFFVFHKQHRPYIILKWAETADGKMAPLRASLLPSGNPYGGKERLLISNNYTNRLVHKWRSEEAAILIGTNTAMLDDPQLTTRFWKGKNPVRLVVDMDLKLSPSLKIFNRDAQTIVFNKLKHQFTPPPWEGVGGRPNISYYQVTEDVNLVHQIVNTLYQLKIQSVIVEGGARLLQSFIDEGIWDEARVIRNKELEIRRGLNAPKFVNFHFLKKQNILSDTIEYYQSSITI